MKTVLPTRAQTGGTVFRCTSRRPRRFASWRISARPCSNLCTTHVVALDHEESTLLHGAIDEMMTTSAAELESATKLVAGRFSVHPVDVDLCQLAREVCEGYEPAAVRRGIELHGFVPARRRVRHLRPGAHRPGTRESRGPRHRAHPGERARSRGARGAGRATSVPGRGFRTGDRAGNFEGDGPGAGRRTQHRGSARRRNRHREPRAVGLHTRVHSSLRRPLEARRLIARRLAAGAPWQRSRPGRARGSGR